MKFLQAIFLNIIIIATVSITIKGIKKTLPNTFNKIIIGIIIILITAVISVPLLCFTTFSISKLNLGENEFENFQSDLNDLLNKYYNEKQDSDGKERTVSLVIVP